MIDASAALEFLLKTAVGTQIDAFVTSATLVAPELLDAEVLSVLRREVRTGRLADVRAKEAVEDLRDWNVQRLAHRPLLETAWQLRNNINAYDALYVAIALNLSILLITADGPLARAPLRGVVIHNVRLP